MKDYIEIKGASEHNLKGIDVKIPRNKFVVVTGVSGSGKSSLAFDTLYAEGQRRYVESLSAYARQFLEQMPKPQVESIEGLSPAIAIEQKTTSNNPRSTVGTVTEIYDYLRVLFARVGTPHCWVCGRVIESMTIQQMAQAVLGLEPGSKVIIYAPVITGRKGEYTKLFESLAKDGFVRVRIDGEVYDIEEVPKLDKKKKHSIDVVVDRLVIKEGISQRLVDSIEIACRLSGGILKIGDDKGGETVYSEHYGCPVCNVSYPEISPRMFSFNNPHGACSHCTGLGVLLEIDPDLVVPNPELSLLQGAILPWGSTPGRFATRLIRHLARVLGFNPNTPFKDLDEEVRHAILYGDHIVGPYGYPYEGVIPNLHRKLAETENGEIRSDISRFLSNKSCPECGGARLKKEMLHVRVAGKNIQELTETSVDCLLEFFNNLRLSPKNEEIAGRLIKEIRDRLGFLSSVGIGYLTLSRTAGTLSSGESQRIRLATQIGSALMGVMYILDEPTIGLHQRDNDRLINTLLHLRDLGNTLIVVEHDEDTIRASDYVIDMGPGAGEKGGEIIFQGTPDELMVSDTSLTGRYLSGKLTVHDSKRRRSPGRGCIAIRGARANNLKSVDVEIPIGLFTCVTGVSGSGKSSLVIDTLYPYLTKALTGSRNLPNHVKSIEGVELIDRVINVDQSPIGRTPRSNPATYTGVFTLIRELFTLLPDSKVRGYKPGRFSFNVKGGRCEACQGDGLIKIAMHFLPDVYVVCDHCQGRRFNDETLEIKYKGHSIADVLDMSVRQAFDLFEAVPSIRRKLQTLIDVGMDYIRLGQSATTLSGGEAQRTKLARELSKRSTGRTLYILDEPTTGLHFDDISKLLKVLHHLVDQGNTVLVIEHNMDIIKSSDYLIDLGPEGGYEGGRIVVTGTPEEVVRCEASHTGRFLKKHLES
ncbi:MAG: excinuclease ABC subunit UvrA [Desulfomonilia bacterium]|jgi:excinuclease ABC subunit A|uniref:ATPase and DNA damage recognition protein of nucleotide excision repair excinuclease UvrABC n=1 Tax=anaerobic digester metagenome TaxID=1263854 RepID=A0A485MDE4_9ZZZZ|nr:excinuclease ABC subunit UvrA [Pseudomonadota bacterium]HON37697.1 excinuclease ABC subunit UvrA [Deltaproteobacteria bacterium]HRS55208.1 excinuclease ABC subunit UvrA [Desulfomonilia bacterium]HPD20374.1 excinuclease ABC subunit UvrA [Deltaproteobacteria bacterium]HPX17169.1 excinuclease ABC subunit UvrA [Deltaproteobacteria bacterium]